MSYVVLLFCVQGHTKDSGYIMDHIRPYPHMAENVFSVGLRFFFFFFFLLTHYNLVHFEMRFKNNVPDYL